MLYGDTPITRQDIENLPIEDLNNFVEQLRIRRLRAYTVYQAAQEAKAEKQFNAIQNLLDKRIEQFTKKLEVVDKGLTALEKYALDILSARAALGHDIQQNRS